MATKNLVPRNSGEGGIGRVGKSWATGFFDALYLGETLVVELLSNKNDGYTIDQNLRTSDDVAFNSGDFSSGLTINGINVATGDHADISTLATNLTDTGVNLQGQIDSFAHAPITGWHTSGANHLLPAISGTQDIGAPNRRVRDLYLEPDSLYLGESNVSVDSSGNLLFTKGDGKILPLTSGNASTSEVVSGALDIRLTDTGVNLQAQITSNDSDISTLTTNLTDTGVNLQAQIDTKVDGAGTADYIAKWSDSDTLSNSIIRDYDDGDGTRQILINHGPNGIIGNDALAISGGLSVKAEGIRFMSSAADGDYVLAEIKADGSTEGKIEIKDNGSVKTLFTASASNPSYINASNLGIGTSNPQHFVHITGDTYIGGDLIVTGTTTTIASVTLTVDDKNIELGSVDAPTDTTADGGGITLKGTTDKTILWENDTDSWDSSENLTTADGRFIMTDMVRARDGDGLSLVGDGNEGIFVEDGGMVGVGQWDPQALLHVGGKTIIEGDLEVSGSTTTVNNIVITGTITSTGFNEVSNRLIETGGHLHEHIDILSGNLTDTGVNLQAQITSNDSDISTLTTNLTDTGVNLQGQIDSFAHPSITGWHTSGANHLLPAISGTQDIGAPNRRVRDLYLEPDSLYLGESNVSVDPSGNLLFTRGDGKILPLTSGTISTSELVSGALDIRLTDTGVNLQAQITSNDSDISTLTTNLTDTGVNLQAQITSNDSDISTLTTNLTDTGVNLQAQITSNDSDISTLTTNLTNTGIHLHGHIDTKVDGAGTVNYIPKWSDSNTLTNSSTIFEKGGQIGIATNNPTVPLQIGGTTVVSGNSARIKILSDSYTIATLGEEGTNQGKLTLNDESTAKIELTSDAASPSYINAGNVGIGTTDPTGLLHLIYTGDSAKDIFVVEDSAHFDETRFTIDHSGQVGIRTSGELTYDVTVGTGEATSFVITTGGRIGIGTENPTGLLHIDGTTHVAYSTHHDGGGMHDHLFIVEDSAHPDATPFVIKNDGKVGIGTTSPTRNLHINGNFRLVDGTEQNNYVLTSDANGNADWQVAPAGGSPIEIKDEGASLTTAVTKIDFVGEGITASEPIADQIQVSVPNNVTEAFVMFSR